MEQSGLTFSDFAWDFVDGRAIQNTGPLPASTPLSEKISKELKRRGFKFVGPTIVYAWMQAVGMVNDHAADCFRRKVCARAGRD
jgi:DNA-3-methyladenine glycosylase I